MNWTTHLNISQFSFRIQVFMNSFVLTLASTSSFSFVPATCNNPHRIGVTCNISSTDCDLLQPCQNQGTCINEKNSSHGYFCRCLWGFNGTQCQYDVRPCKANTCWNNGSFETILLNMKSKFIYVRYLCEQISS